VGSGDENGAVDLITELDAPCSSHVLFAHVDDLGLYPDWLEIVERAEATELHPDDDGDAAWLVDLRGRLGPLARSKRLRMVRTELEAPDLVRFERREHDGRDHSPWVLEGRVHATEPGSRLEMRLHYGGSFGGSVLERLLSDAIERSRPVLLSQIRPGNG
jgi:Polyketide cyclase / dehydrase and lipid transport